MKHFILDCKCKYKSSFLSNERTIFYNMKQICKKLDLKPITEPILRPYFECNAKDSGISCVMLLENGGHITFHSFSKRKSYYMDIVGEGDIFNAGNVYCSVKKFFPFSEKESVFKTTKNNEHYDKGKHFGPHLIYEINGELDFEKIYCILDSLPGVIGMTKITHPILAKEEGFINGIVIIAESHISIHYNIEEKKCYIDIFSCMPFDIEKTDKLFSEIGYIHKKNILARYNKFELEKGKKYGK